MAQKTLLVGWDAACWDYLNPLLEQDRLPALKQLMETGGAGKLMSTMPPWTPTAWSSLVTGKNPGKHGIFDMLWRKPGTYEFSPTNATHRMGTPFWRHLNQAGLRTGLVNVPFSYPPGEVDGFLVCGFGTPPVPDFAFPAEAVEWINSNIDDFASQVDPEILRTAPPDYIFNSEQKLQGDFVKAAGELAQQYEVEVLVINLMFPDHANHKMPEMSQVEASYERTDRDLAKLIETFQPDNTILISDHGSSRLKGDFWLGKWLLDRGYLVEFDRSEKEIDDAVNALVKDLLKRDYGLNPTVEKFARRIGKNLLLRAPDFLKDLAWKRVEKHRPNAREFIRLSGMIDFQRTKLFPSSAYSGLLYLNMAGREEHGEIEPQQRRDLLEQLRDELMEITAPDTGQALFSNIFFPEDIFEGDAVPWAPDLILDAYDQAWNIRTTKFAIPPGEPVSDYFFTKTIHKDFGWHSKDGILVVSGKDFSARADIGTHNLLDIPATLLHLHQVPVPEDYDGQVLLEIMSEELRDRPVKKQAGDSDRVFEEVNYEEEESEILLRQLRALGYLD